MPPEPDIHAPIASVKAQVARLDAALDAAVPPKRAGNNILVATWNIRALSNLTKAWTTPQGASPKRNFADIHYLAAYLRQGDLQSISAGEGPCGGRRHEVTEWRWGLPPHPCGDYRL